MIRPVVLLWELLSGVLASDSPPASARPSTPGEIRTVQVKPVQSQVIPDSDVESGSHHATLNDLVKRARHNTHVVVRECVLVVVSMHDCCGRAVASF
jgi:hypothetical protein